MARSESLYPCIFVIEASDEMDTDTNHMLTLKNINYYHVRLALIKEEDLLVETNNTYVPMNILNRDCEI